MMLIFLESSLLASVLLIWFKSEAFVEYSKLFRVGNLFFVPLYEEENSKDPALGYLDYLAIRHDCFFVKLITCPLCLGFWLSLFITIGYGNILELPIVYLCGVLLYGASSKSLQ